MKKMLLIFSTICATLSLDLEARCYRRPSRGSSFAAGIIGALTGAAVAASLASCDYYSYPEYEFVYPAVPLLAYDYPTYVYSPVYAYADTRFRRYPSYYLMR